MSFVISFSPVIVTENQGDHTMDKKSFPTEFPELLYFGKGNTMASTPHFHSFYQLEICIDGEFHGKSKEKSIRLLPGNYWLIPPETLHHFVSYKKTAEYYTLKFNFSPAIPETELHDDVTRYHLEAIRRIICNESAPSAFSDAGKEIIESHLYAFLHHIASQVNQPRKDESDFIMRLKEEICCHGYRMNVSELVQFCRCTRSQFKYRFKKESHWKGSIKKFIDHVLFEVAQNHLKYSGMSLSRIAEVMHFPNLSLFSRFIRNQSGYPPSEYRKILRENQDAK